MHLKLPKGDRYELKDEDGRLIVFRPDSQLNDVESSNGYRLTAGYSDGLVNQLSASNGDRFWRKLNLKSDRLY